MSFFEFPNTRNYDKDLGWLIKDYEHLTELYKALDQWKNDTQPTIDDFKELYEQITSGDLPESMTDAINTWMFENAIDLVGQLVKHVHFGLTNDGYFCAFIPDNWSDITFDTVNDFDDPLYGHLMLIYD